MANGAKVNRFLAWMTVKKAVNYYPLPITQIVSFLDFFSKPYLFPTILTYLLIFQYQ
jgi:hypothetical protein